MSAIRLPLHVARGNAPASARSFANLSGSFAELFCASFDATVIPCSRRVVYSTQYRYPPSSPQLHRRSTVHTLAASGHRAPAFCTTAFPQRRFGPRAHSPSGNEARPPVSGPHMTRAREWRTRQGTAARKTSKVPKRGGADGFPPKPSL